MFRGAIMNGRHATQRLTGRWFARGGVLWARQARERRLEFETLATAQARPEDFAAVAGGNGEPVPDSIARSAGGDVATSLWNGSESVMTVVRPGADAVTISCGAPECRSARVVWLAWRPDHDEIVFANADRAHVQTLHLWDVGGNRVRPVATSDGLLNGGRNATAPCAIARRQAVCVAAGPVAPPRLETIDLEAGGRRLLFDPNATLRSRRWPIVERLEWRSAEGRLFTGTMFMPRERAGRLPLFLNYYRCEGFLRGGEGDEWPLATLANSGIASVCVNATRMTGPQDR